MTAVRTITATTVLLLGTAACSAAGDHPSAGPLPSAGETTVEVTNNNWSDMKVYAIRSGMRMRLGTITSMTTRRLEVPRSVTGSGAQLQIVVVPIAGSEGFNTGPLVVSPGQQIELTIQNHLAISSYAVWE